MTSNTFIGLVNNAALLMALALIYDVVVVRQPGQKASINQIPIGGILGLIGLAIMMNPWEFLPGVIFDTRSILLSISGLFFGTVPTLVSVLMTGGYRLFLGGTGAWTGFAVILTSGLVGLAWRHWIKKDSDAVSMTSLYLMGVVTHILMLLWMLSLPRSIAFGVLSKISLPVILIFPLGTLLLGKLIINRRKRIKAVQAVEESEIRYRGIVEDSPGMICRFLPNSEITYVNKAYCDHFGKTFEDLVGKSFLTLIPEDNHKEVMDNISALTIDSPSQSHDHQVVGPGSNIRWHRWTNRGIFDDKGNIVSYQSAGEDITDRKRTEEELRRRESQYNAIVENTGDYIMRYDRNHRHIYANHGAIEVTGLSPDQYLGKTHREMGFPDHLCTLWKKNIDDVFATGEVRRVEFDVELQDGIVSLDLQMNPEFSADGQVQSVIGVSRDITERKQAEAERDKLQAQLNQAQKMESVGRLAGGVAHDFNNMLSIILGNTEMTMEEVPPDNPHYANLQEIKKAARHSADITRQLLAFARKQTIAPRVMNLNKTLKSMLKMIRRLIGEDINLVWLPGKALWSVRMDPSQIDQILANLCVNARDAISGVGKVTIETGKTTFDEAYCADHPGFIPGAFVVLAVSDDGYGMDKETLNNLFEPFFTTKDVDKGTGLGLATVYGIVKQNNGFINVYSEPGQGTTFKIYLPRHRVKTDALPEKVKRRPTEHGHETILLVEDEPSILKMTTQMLERLGYTILAAVTPKEAIRLAREHGSDIHLLMTDVIMPEMNGRDLASNLLSTYPKLKRLFMSGYTANVIAHHGVLDEGVNFIQKPFSKHDLSVKLREILDDAKN